MRNPTKGIDVSAAGLQAARDKMLAAGVSAPAIEVFSRFYELLESGETGVIREDTSERYEARLPLLLMNSFRTQDDTLAHLARYPELPVEGLPLSFLQNQEPKLRADDLTPVEWAEDPTLEWCPPGHGDLYPALEGSGVLD